MYNVTAVNITIQFGSFAILYGNLIDLQIHISELNYKKNMINEEIIPC